MKLRYMIEYVLHDRIRKPLYKPIGVWVQGPGTGIDLVVEFLPGNTEAREEADWIINRLVEQGVRSLPEDFLMYHQRTLSQYRGMRGPVIETNNVTSSKACTNAIIKQLKDYYRALANKNDHFLQGVKI